MKRRIAGLHEADRSAANEVRDGLFLVRVQRAQFRWRAHKPYYILRFLILEPKSMARRSITGRVCCTQKALWKFSWFLREFGYDTEMLRRDEVDEKALVGLCGAVKISHTIVHGTSLLNLDGFAPASQWEELSAALATDVGRSEVA